MINLANSNAVAHIDFVRPALTFLYNAALPNPAVTPHRYYTNNQHFINTYNLYSLNESSLPNGKKNAAWNK